MNLQSPAALIPPKYERQNSLPEIRHKEHYVLKFIPHFFLFFIYLYYNVKYSFNVLKLKRSVV
jgi:hypothetical protein